MKLDYAGITAAILAFTSVGLPWWTFTESQDGRSSTLSWYLWGLLLPTGTAGNPLGIGVWAGYAAMALVTLGAVLGLAGSLIHVGRRKIPLLVTGGLTFVALGVFLLGFLSVPKSGAWGSFGAVFYNSARSYSILDPQPRPLGCLTSLLVCPDFMITSYLSAGYWVALASGTLWFSALTARVIIERRLENGKVGKYRPIVQKRRE